MWKGTVWDVWMGRESFRQKKQSPQQEALQETDLGLRRGLQPCLCPTPNLKLRDHPLTTE